MNEARIAPSHSSSIHHIGKTRLMGAQHAVEKLSGKAMAKPESAPSLIAVPGPAP